MNMERKRKLYLAKVAVIMSAVPILIWAYEYGPDAGYSGVPNELGTCTGAQCHIGTTNDPANKGSVSVAFPNGQTYTPGVKQHLVVTIADPAQHAWGFQLTVRLASNTATVAGTLASTDQNTTMMCAAADFNQQREAPYVAGQTQTCPASMPLRYVEHSLAGYNASKGHTGSQTYEFDWTPPATNAGDVKVYVSGNAANGDLRPTGDHIYNTSFTLTPTAAGSTPAITPNGVVSAGAFGGFPSVAPGSWMEIYGTSLSATTRLWTGADFTGSQAPTSLDNVKVTIGGQAAFIDYISPTQVNAQVPSTTPTGQQQMTVSTSVGTSSAYTINVNALEPGLLAPSTFVVGGKQYVVAQFGDGVTYVLPPNAIPGLPSRQAKPGETIIIYGIGFGPVLDSGDQNIPAGTVVTASNKLANSFAMDFGGVTATLQYFGLAPNYVGLYQFNVVVPSVANNDLVPLAFKLNGAGGSQTLFTAVHN
jgi:uncharacterized protein (TIGR03437 family)